MQQIRYFLIGLVTTSLVYIATSLAFGIASIPFTMLTGDAAAQFYASPIFALAIAATFISTAMYIGYFGAIGQKGKPSVGRALLTIGLFLIPIGWIQIILLYYVGKGLAIFRENRARPIPTAKG